jgi:hypothetical protein
MFYKQTVLEPRRDVQDPGSGYSRAQVGTTFPDSNLRQCQYTLHDGKPKES